MPAPAIAAIVYSIACQKGGVGKTSTTIAVAAGLARKGKRVLIIDIDSQANCSKVLLKHYQDLKKDQTTKMPGSLLPGRNARLGFWRIADVAVFRLLVGCGVTATSVMARLLRSKR